MCPPDASIAPWVAAFAQAWRRVMADRDAEQARPVPADQAFPQTIALQYCSAPYVPFLTHTSIATSVFSAMERLA